MTTLNDSLRLRSERGAEYLGRSKQGAQLFKGKTHEFIVALYDCWNYTTIKYDSEQNVSEVWRVPRVRGMQKYVPCGNTNECDYVFFTTRTRRLDLEKIDLNTIGRLI